MSFLPNLPDEHPSSIPPLVPYNSAETGERLRGDGSMEKSWKQWEGEVIGGEFPLHEYLGASERGAVFLTEAPAREPRKAALRLLPADSPAALEQMAHWQEATSLSHPHLLPLLTAGRCELNGVEFVYVVMDYAEENLGQVLPQRPLTPAEAAEMLPPLLEALEFVHRRGFIHGDLKPANIMAAADQLKISSDCLWPAGQKAGANRVETEYDPPEFSTEPLSPSADVWSLGVTLVEGLMRRLPTWDAATGGDPALPEGMPQPFAEIARHCLRLAPDQRWTIAQIAAHLQPAAAEAPQAPVPSPRVEPAAAPEAGETLSRRAQAPATPRPRRRGYLVPAAVIAFVLLGLAGLRMIHIHPGIPHAPAPATEVPMASAPAQPPASQPETKPTPAIASPREPTPPAVPQNVLAENQKPVVAPPLPVVTPKEARPAGDTQNSGDEDESSQATSAGVLRQKLPHVSQASRDTIQGHVRVSVKVSVDPAGNVTNAAFESAGPSKYFARLALESAREWTFVPAEAPGQKSRQWILHFAFGRTGTDVRATRATP